MPEFRQNIATRDWVIIATDRAKRPQTLAVNGATSPIELPSHDEKCPFCIGNEELDLETDRIPKDPTQPWQVRAVRNKYPALSEDINFHRSFTNVERRISGLGYHEVIIEHPAHNTTLALMEPDEIALFFEIVYRRGWKISEDPRIEYIVYFRNHGERAGASLVHPHSQIIALPVVPNVIRKRTEEARRYFDDTGQCVYCAMMHNELEHKARVVVSSQYFIAFVLYAAPTPFHMWIMPLRHDVSFLYTKQEERIDLANVIKQVLAKLYIGLNNPAYNLIVRSSPIKEIENDYLHWYITLVPRLSRTAGFELGSGIHINPTLPEACAEFLRGVNI
ncbi:MAG: galactose-1-phosphate uridylyltransferase [Anaerolineaceae bacterium 4572_78]|nr:MAG: galactose-1-phosphate uridylyltransferase [Anaerolineaceae bacterium 4572_78]